MKRVRILKIFFLISALALVVGGAFLFFSLFPRSPADFPEALARVDHFLERKEKTKAQKLILVLSGKKLSGRRWTALLARALRWGEAYGNYEIYGTAAARGLLQYPGNQDIRAASVSSLLWTGHTEAAEKEAADLDPQTYRGLLGEIKIRSVQESLQSSDSPPSADRPLETFWKHIPSETMAGLGDFLAKPSIKFDALLLALFNRKKKEAETLFDALAPGDGTDIPASVLVRLAIRMGDYRRARDYLKKILQEYGSGSLASQNKQALFYELLGDVYTLRDDLPNAKTAYLQTLSQDDVKPVHYLKMAVTLFQLDPKKPSLPRKILKLGLEKFPDNKVLNKSYIYFLQNDPGMFSRYIESYLDEYSDPEIELQKTLTLSFTGPAQKIASLWDLYNRYPYNNSIGLALGKTLLTQKHFSDLQILLSRMENMNYRPGWSLLLGGIMKALRQDYKDSLLDLQKALEADHSGENEYNLALVSFYNGETDKSAGLLQQSMNPPDLRIPEEERLKINFLQGMIHQTRGENNEARKIYESILDKDPTRIKVFARLNELVNKARVSP